MKTFFIMTIVMLSVSAISEELFIMGGSGHDKFLGCLTCSEYSSDSICNGYGKYGNQYSSSSMWNEYSRYGSEYSSISPWNEYTSGSSVPVLVDHDGRFYGYFTINEYRSKTVNFASDMNEWFKDSAGDLEKVRLKLCRAFGKGD